MAAKDYSSDSEGHGADVTTTAVHDSPFEVPQDPDQSMQVDDLAGVDIPSDMQENQEGRDIQGYLESLNRSPTTEISSSSDAEVPEAPVRLSAGPRMWIHRGRSNLAVSLQQRLRHQVPSGDKPDKLRLTQWTGYTWVEHWKLYLHRMM